MRFDPRVVICLGDNFHDGDGAARLSREDRDELLALQRGRDWIWIAGNHDPDPAAGIGGRFHGSATIGGIVFRHEPSARSDNGIAEIAGHLHPVARVSTSDRSLRARCFVADARRMVMPAFGAFTGGLNIRDRAFAPVFAGPGVVAHMLGRSRLHAVPAMSCLPD
jgi:DNA ligase-associated metallophosphoesterase